MGTYFDAREEFDSILESSWDNTREFAFYLTKIGLKMPKIWQKQKTQDLIHGKIHDLLLTMTVHRLMVDLKLYFRDCR